MSSEQASVGGPAASFALRPSLAAGSHADALLPLILASLAFPLAAPDARWGAALCGRIALIVANLGRSRPAAGA